LTPCKSEEVTAEKILEAYEAKKKFLPRAPVKRVGNVWASDQTQVEPYCFKVNGVFNKVRQLKDPEGLVTASTGSHGRSLAYVGKRVDIPVVVVVPSTIPEAKESAIEQYGAKVQKVDGDFKDAQRKALELMFTKGYELVHPFDDPDIVIGQGIAAVELLEQLPGLNGVYVPTAGGGFLAGVATYIKSVWPDTKVCGVQPHGACAMAESFYQGRLVRIPEVRTSVDALAIDQACQLNLDLIRKHVDGFALVSDASTFKARNQLAEYDLLVEPAGAIAYAPLMSVDTKGWAFFASGKNLEGS